MNKMLTSAIAIGAGMMAYNYAQRNKMTRRGMKKMQRKITKMF